MRVVASLERKIGGEGIQTLEANKIAAASTYWHQLLSNSTVTLARLVQKHKWRAALLSESKLPPTRQFLVIDALSGQVDELLRGSWVLWVGSWGYETTVHVCVDARFVFKLPETIPSDIGDGYK